jgi:hypothetical protein
MPYYFIHPISPPISLEVTTLSSIKADIQHEALQKYSWPEEQLYIMADMTYR